MSRPIRFRAWDDFQNKYVFEGFHICGEVTCFGGMECVINETAKERKAARGYKSSIEAWNDFTFEQFTGLKDKNGKDIYEGDIVKYFDLLFIIKFGYGRFYGEGKFDELQFDSCEESELEIAGNIRENKDIRK